MNLRHRSARWATFSLVTCAGCTSAGAPHAGGDAATESGTAWFFDAAPAVYDGGAVVIQPEDAAATPPPVCAPGPRTTATGFCDGPGAALVCPSCAPTGYSCEAGAAPSEVIVAGGACYTVATGTCCTVGECTQTTALNDACADGGLAYYCPPGAGGGPLGLNCAAPDASAPRLACCFF